jgi:hypothetical protein
MALRCVKAPRKPRNPVHAIRADVAVRPVRSAGERMTIRGASEKFEIQVKIEKSEIARPIIVNWG